MNNEYDDLLTDEECDEEICFEFLNQNGTKTIYPGSKIVLNEFNTLFMGMVDHLAIAETHKDVVLEFIRLLMPPDNNIPNSYNLIKKFAFGTNLQMV